MFKPLIKLHSRIVLRHPLYLTWIKNRKLFGVKYDLYSLRKQLYCWPRIIFWKGLRENVTFRDILTSWYLIILYSFFPNINFKICNVGEKIVKKFPHIFHFQKMKIFQNCTFRVKSFPPLLFFPPLLLFGIIFTYGCLATSQMLLYS